MFCTSTRECIILCIFFLILFFLLRLAVFTQEYIYLYGILYLNVCIWTTYLVVSYVNSLNVNNIESSVIDVELRKRETLNTIHDTVNDSSPSSNQRMKPMTLQSYKKYNWIMSFVHFNFPQPNLIRSDHILHYFNILSKSSIMQRYAYILSFFMIPKDFLTQV